MVFYVVQCLHNDCLKPTLCNGGVPATCEATMDDTVWLIVGMLNYKG